MAAVNDFYKNMRKLEDTEMFLKLERKLRENRWYKPVLDFAEVSTNVNRVYLVSGALNVLLLGMLFEYGVSLITTGVGFIYPLYKTLSALEKSNPADEKKWLIYWFIHASLNFAETFLFLMYWLPGYWMLKCGFLYWCCAPVEKNGSDIVYTYLIQPSFQTNQEALHQEALRTAATAHSLFTDSADTQNMEALLHTHQN